VLHAGWVLVADEATLLAARARHGLVSDTGVSNLLPLVWAARTPWV